MSRAFALVKFKKTDNIYFGCYDGTSDIMIPFLCTPQECYEEEHDCYSSITYCKDLADHHNNWQFPNDIVDLDDVEIYSDYGGGFYWNGTGSESIKMLKKFLYPWEEADVHIKDGIPEWADEFLKRL